MSIGKNRTGLLAAIVLSITGLVAVAAMTLPASGATTVHTRKFTAVQMGKDHQVGKFSLVASDVERHHGKAIGTDSLSIKFDPKAGVAHIFVAVAWKGGALIVRGHQSQTGDFLGQIVRGTGKYTGAQGTVIGHDVPHSNKTHVVVKYAL